MGVGLGGTYLMMCDVQKHEFHRRYNDFRKWKYVDLEIQYSALHLHPHSPKMQAHMQHSLHHDLRSKKHRGRSGSSAGRPYSKWNRDVHNFPIAVDRAQANPLRFPHAPPSSSATSPNTHRNIEAAFSNFFAGGRSQWCGSGHETKQRLSNPNFRQRKHKRRRYNAHIPLYTFSQYHDEPFYLEWWSGTRPEKRQESKKRKRKNQRDERAHTERERERERD